MGLNVLIFENFETIKIDYTYRYRKMTGNITHK